MSAKNVSDHWKEKVLLVYAGEIATRSLRILLVLVFCSFPVLLLGLVGSAMDADVFSLLQAPLGMGFATVIGVVYAVLRVRTEAASRED